MASYFLALTILVVISVAYGHGGSESLGVSGGNQRRDESGENRDGSEHNPFFSEFEAFNHSLTDAQREVFFNIIRDWNLTKAERQAQLATFSAGLAGDAKTLYQNLSTTFQELKDNVIQKLEDVIANLTKTGEEILALVNNQSISDVATLKALGELEKQNSAARYILESVRPHVEAHQEHPLHVEYGNDHGSSAHVSENGHVALESANVNFARGSSNGNVALGNFALESANGNSVHGSANANSALESANGNSAHRGANGNVAHGEPNGIRAKRLI